MKKIFIKTDELFEMYGGELFSQKKNIDMHADLLLCSL